MVSWGVGLGPEIKISKCPDFVTKGTKGQLCKLWVSEFNVIP